MIASPIFILCILQLIRIAQPNFKTHRIESPHAYIIVLTNTSVIIFLLQHVFSFLNIVAQTHVIASVPFPLCMLRVIRIAYANFTIQCSESLNAYTFALTNTFIRLHRFMLIHPNITDENETADTCNIVSTTTQKKHYTPRHLHMAMKDELFLSSVGSIRQYSLTSLVEEQNTDAHEHQLIQQSSLLRHRYI